MKYGKALREASREIVVCVVHPAAWRDAWAGAVALLFILLRAVMFLAFPITAPLVALAKVRADRSYRRGVRRADRDWLGE